MNVTARAFTCLVSFGLLTPINGQALTSPDVVKPAIIIHLLNQGSVPEQILSNARSHVSRIFGSSGIDVKWAGSGALDVTVVLAGVDDEHVLDPGNDGRTGSALSNNGRGIRRAYILSERVKEQSWSLIKEVTSTRAMYELPVLMNRKTMESLLLGHVIAHEVGHLLLPSGSHSVQGIMAPYMRREDLRLAVSGQLRFLPRQGEWMRNVLRGHERPLD
jgi:hypothetical protein